MSVIVLKFIVSVEMIDAEKLESSVFMNTGVVLNEGLQWEPLCTIGMAKLEILDQIEGKNRLFSHTFEAVLSDRFSVGNRKLCFRLTAVDGSQYVIGTFSRPFPIVKHESSFPAEITGNCVARLSVSWKYTHFYPVLCS